MVYPVPGHEYIKVAELALQMQPPDPAWRERAACLNPAPEIAGITALLPKSANEGEVERRETRFISLACIARCSVKDACFFDALLTDGGAEPATVRGGVRGGRTSHQMGKYVDAVKIVKARRAAASAQSETSDNVLGNNSN